MPSVGMRRSTRVLGAIVLRSGRRLWTEPPHEDGKFIRAVRENEWIDILDDSMGGGDAGDPCKIGSHGNGKGDAMFTVEEHKVEEDANRDVGDVDKMRGIVYVRKRKREVLKSSGSCEDKRFGKKFFRKKCRNKYKAAAPLEAGGDYSVDTASHQKLAVVAIKPSYDSSHWISCFLCSVLYYMRRVDIRLRLLSVFVHSKLIFDGYSSHGILFLQGSIPIKSPGLCIISGSRSLIPMFAVDFSAVPFCFLYLHSCMQLRLARLAFVFVAVPLGINENIGEVTFQISLSLGKDTCNSSSVVSSIGGLRQRDSSQTTGGLPKLALRSMQYRNSRHVQKRSSLKRKRGRPASAFRAKKSHGPLASDLLRFRQNATHSSSAAPNRILGSFAKTSPSKYIKELKSAVGMDENRPSTHSKELKAAMGLIPQNTGASCSANLLIIETDKCYREEGAIITLELSASKQWVLAVMKDGMKRYSLTTQSVMRPSCSNHFTNATLWSGDGGWKLEFPKKQDWLIFKELYKECSDRNEQAPTASVIPVPGVQVASNPVQNNYIPYVRPDSYITVNDDELARALLKMTANYDMDSDDEKWLNEFNVALSSEGEIHDELITPERFELVVDALEKGFHCNEDDHSDEKAAYDFCIHLERKEFVEAIHKYWIKKRRQKQSALVRIFQLYKPRRSHVIPKSILRKKRSFKRQASQAGRGKQRTFLQEMVAERDTSEHNNNLFKLQEARAFADRSEHSAVLKRQRAQILMENADLTTYKAIMALRITEAAEIVRTPGAVASFFLDPLTK